MQRSVFGEGGKKESVNPELMLERGEISRSEYMDLIREFDEGLSIGGGAARGKGVGMQVVRRNDANGGLIRKNNICAERMVQLMHEDSGGMGKGKVVNKYGKFVSNRVMGNTVQRGGGAAGAAAGGGGRIRGEKGVKIDSPCGSQHDWTRWMAFTPAKKFYCNREGCGFFKKCWKQCESSDTCMGCHVPGHRRWSEAEFVAFKNKHNLF